MKHSPLYNTLNLQRFLIQSHSIIVDDHRVQEVQTNEHIAAAAQKERLKNIDTCKA
jgi:hypothetical protein